MGRKGRCWFLLLAVFILCPILLQLGHLRLFCSLHLTCKTEKLASWFCFGDFLVDLAGEEAGEKIKVGSLTSCSCSVSTSHADLVWIVKLRGCWKISEKKCYKREIMCVSVRNVKWSSWGEKTFYIYEWDLVQLLSVFEECWVHGSHSSVL